MISIHKVFTVASATLLIIWGVFIIYSSVSSISWWLNTAIPHAQAKGYQISWWKFILTHHHGIFLSILCPVGAALLLFGKRIGWIISAGVSLKIWISNSYLLLSNEMTERPQSYDSEWEELLLFILSIIIVFFLVTIALLIKTTRKKLNINSTQVWFSMAIALVLIVDRLLI